MRVHGAQLRSCLGQFFCDFRRTLATDSTIQALGGLRSRCRRGAERKRSGWVAAASYEGEHLIGQLKETLEERE